MFGNVVINCGDGKIPDEQLVRNLLLGKPTRLESKFRLTYSMILNLLRVEDLRVEDMIKRSFSEFGTQRHEATHKSVIEQGERMLNSMGVIDCIYGQPELISQYFDVYESRRQYDGRALGVFVYAD